MVLYPADERDRPTERRLSFHVDHSGRTTACAVMDERGGPTSLPLSFFNGLTTRGALRAKSEVETQPAETSAPAARASQRPIRRKY